MAHETEVGRLHGVLDISNTDWLHALEEARQALARFVIAVRDQFAEISRSIQKAGVGMTIGITVPFAALIRTVDRGAGSFEAQMKRVESALLRARLLDEIDETRDTLRFYRLGADGKRKVEHGGTKAVLDLDGPLLF